jgi:hypothetical protein
VKRDNANLSSPPTPFIRKCGNDALDAACIEAVAYEDELSGKIDMAGHVAFAQSFLPNQTQGDVLGRGMITQQTLTYLPRQKWWSVNFSGRDDCVWRGYICGIDLCSTAFWSANFWSAVTCHRFGPARLDAPSFTGRQRQTGCDRSQKTKALTGHRTPKSCRLHLIRAS